MSKSDPLSSTTPHAIEWHWKLVSSGVREVAPLVAEKQFHRNTMDRRCSPAVSIHPYKQLYHYVIHTAEPRLFLSYLSRSPLPQTIPFSKHPTCLAFQFTLSSITLINFQDSILDSRMKVSNLKFQTSSLKKPRKSQHKTLWPGDSPVVDLPK